PRSYPLFPYTTLFRYRLEIPGEILEILFQRAERLGEDRLLAVKEIDRSGVFIQPDALMIARPIVAQRQIVRRPRHNFLAGGHTRSEEHTSELQSLAWL